MRPSSFTGGSARNALPREASAIISIAPEHVSTLLQAFAKWQDLLRQELRGADEGVRVDGCPASTDKVMSPSDQKAWLRSLHAAPHGVKRMSISLTGVIETSNNLGMVDLQPEVGSCNLMVRSNIDSTCEELADEIKSHSQRST